MPLHDPVDVSVSVVDNAHVYTGRCRCGWESAPCQTSVHAIALVEDHGNRSRLRSRRRTGRTWVATEPGADRNAS